MNGNERARARYRERLEELASQRDGLVARSRILVTLRTVLFFAAAILLASGYLGSEPRGWLLGIGWSTAFLFLMAITFHEHLRLSEQANLRSAKLIQRLLHRLDRRWDQLEILPSGVAERSPLAEDLDLFGKASLWQLLSLPSTGFGRQTLGQWLLNTPPWPTVLQRQAAVKELRDATQQREAILERIATISDGKEDATLLAKWASGPRWLPTHRMAHALSYIGPCLVAIGFVTLIVAAAISSNEDSNKTIRVGLTWTAAGLIGGGFAVNLLLTLGWGSWLHDIFARITGSNLDAQQLRTIFEQIGHLPGASPQLAGIRQKTSLGETSAVAGFRQLVWRVRLANLQRDPLFYVVYLILQLTIAWDFRIIKSLEGWQIKFGSGSPQWFEALGECEALIAAATLADEYTDWCFPEPIPSSLPADADALIASMSAMGHPLLPDEQRVVNDLEMRASQPLLLVTGSNMAGKSTLLRSLGLNQILARTGAPVCAATYRSPLFDLASSIRVRDSLQEGVSFFMAELKRLKEVVDIAERAGSEPNRPRVMFLLDEILQGTNSRERQIAVVKVVQRLLECGATGAISTHDLELADQATVQRVSQIVHFREYFEVHQGVEKMRFDYLMRPGPTPTTNALKLLDMVGLGVDRAP